MDLIISKKGLKMKKTFVLVGSLLFLSGCAKHYDIEPKTNSGMMSINGLVFPNAKLASHSKTNTPTTKYMGKFLHKKELYHTRDKSCELIKYELKRALNQRYYMNYDARLWNEKRVKEGGLAYCDETHVGNVAFVGCKNAKNNSMFYFVGTSKVNSNGYGFNENKTLWIKSKKCFDKILNHFKKVAKKDSIKIKTFRFK